MIESSAIIARWFQLAANLILLGSCVFLTIVSVSKQAYEEEWIKKLERSFLWLAFIVPTGLLAILTMTIIQISGDISLLAHRDTWLNIITNTQVGQVWIGRFASAILLLITVIYLHNVSSRTRWHYVICALVASLPLIASSLASHTAAEELSVIAVLPYALHLIFAGIWLGALPAFLLLFYTARQYDDNQLKVKTLERFSTLALPVMIMIILSGFVVGDRIFDGQYAALVATTYGWLLSSKLILLVFILLIAWCVRSHWLPVMTNHDQSGSTVIASKDSIWKWVRIELFLALILVLLATIITHTTPVKHAVIENWPFPFRFSIAATWNQPNVAAQVWMGLILVLSALAVFKLGKHRNWVLKRIITISMILMISGLAIALPPLAIKAYPETYRKSPVPFDAISIANGASVFIEHCVECHGYQGKGNGIKSRTLSTKMPDLLVEPHIREHTPGDFFNWITHGMAGTDMPGYADKIPDEDRWDVINFIHALSRGYQARVLAPEVVPDNAFVKPPVFSYSGHDGSNGALQDFRDTKAVLLVFFSWPQSQMRIERLKLIYDRLSELNIAVLAIPLSELAPDELVQASIDLPFPIVTQGANEISASYSLWRRTMNNPDIIGRGTTPDHMEFLIDRNGYLRARWIPEGDQTGWAEIAVLIRQINLLNNEKAKTSLLDDYIR
ncbi:MAG: c-type cytochrome [Nitrosomonas sp.]|nr:MAG: c-type cytochrome [Nitrosomonas sp.]